MATCNYVYLSGLRAKSGTPIVEIDGVKYRVIRNGKGRSRLDRWADEPLPDGCVGEISLRDLSEKLVERGASNTQVTVSTPDGTYTVTLDPERAMGEDGREYGDITLILAAMDAAGRRAAALDQIRTAPESGENIEAAQARIDAAIAAGLTPQEILSVASDGFYLTASDELLVALAATTGVELAEMQSRRITAGGETIPEREPTAEKSPILERLLANAGVSWQDARYFSVAEIKSPDDMIRCKQAGVSGYEAGRFSKAGFKSPEDIIKLRKAWMDGKIDLEKLLSETARQD
jgi:hypothetical protein